MDPVDEEILPNQKLIVVPVDQSWIEHKEVTFNHPVTYVDYFDYLARDLQNHKNFGTLPLDLRFRIKNYRTYNGMTTTILVAIENYLNHILPMGYFLEGSVLMKFQTK